MASLSSSNVVIVGGGIIGTSVAHALADSCSGLKITVVEPDPSYEWAATPRATGTIRRTFTLPEKVLMSNYAHEVYSRFNAMTAIDGEEIVDIHFRKDGFLFMGWGPEEVARLTKAKELISRHYPAITLLDPDEIAARYPSICTDDVEVGLFAPDDGWIDPASALQGYARKAKNLGVVFKQDRVVDFVVRDRLVRDVVLQSGKSIKADIVVNCANCWAADVAVLVGMKLPVRPLRRMTYYFDVRAELEPLPLTRDSNGISVRPEGAGYITGITNYEDPYGFNWDLDYDWFDHTIWPAIATRIPAFEAVKLINCWSGHYDMNTLDGTAIIGPWVGGIENFYVAAGFSGHGLQQAPAVGLALKELIVDGGYQTIDLSRLGYQRVIDERPLADDGPRS